MKIIAIFILHFFLVLHIIYNQSIHYVFFAFYKQSMLFMEYLSLKDTLYFRFIFDNTYPCYLIL